MKLQLSELLSQKSDRSLFDKAMQYTMDKASHMAGRLKLDGRQVNVRPWPQDSQIERFHAALRKYDIDYDESTCDEKAL